MTRDEFAGMPEVLRNVYLEIYNSCLRRIDNGIERRKAIHDAVNSKFVQLKEEGIKVVNDSEQWIDCITSLLNDDISHTIEFKGKHEQPVEIVSPETKTSCWWSKRPIDYSSWHGYWNRYKKYLITVKGRYEDDVTESIDEPTDSLMDRLVNPKCHKKDDRVGLVFGHVQSGKTAHYIGLINKAIDAGYSYIVVLAGLHNNLRSQTQTRIDKEVYGIITNEEIIKARNREGMFDLTQGVGKIDDCVQILTPITTSDENGDINKHDKKQERTPAYCVVKKNQKSLSDLLDFFKRQPGAVEDDVKSPHFNAKYSLLMIDDEADQASLNTKDCYDKDGNIKDDYKPTTINKLIREILELFDLRSYVGYTATPFANIFSYSEVQKPDEEYGPILFPKDFIVTIPRSPDYIGAREFFGWKNTYAESQHIIQGRAMPLFRPIDDESDAACNDEYFDSDDEGSKYNNKKLEKALLSFLISTASRNLRGQKFNPNSMLIHIDRKVKSQDEIYADVRKMWKDICLCIKNEDPVTISNLRNLWDDDYLKTTEFMRENFAYYMTEVPALSWDDVWAEIRRLTDIDINTYEPDDESNRIILYKINGSSKDALQYEKMRGKEYNVIAVGGDKLSRGLTLEGLTVSFFARPSKTYDTLMQMGRWFGYRPGYVDLCRLYVPTSLYTDFQEISIATDDLLLQLETFSKDETCTPMDVGLNVIKAPNLLICSKNKMKGVEKIRESFSGEFSQSQLIDVDAKKYEKNFEAVVELVRSCEKRRPGQDIKTYKRNKGFDSSSTSHAGKDIIWEDIPYDEILKFFSNYRTSKHAKDVRSDNIINYINIQSYVGELIEWNVCLRNYGSFKHPVVIDKYSVGCGKRKNKNNKSAKLSYGGSCYDLRALTPGNDEFLDYDAEMIKKIDNLKSEIKSREKSVSPKKLAKYIRENTRGEKGLLILYPIDMESITELKCPNSCLERPPIGFAIVFPRSKGIVRLPERVLNEVGVRLRRNDE